MHLHIGRVCRVHTLLQSHPWGCDLSQILWGTKAGKAELQLYNCPTAQDLALLKSKAAEPRLVHVHAFSRCFMANFILHSGLLLERKDEPFFRSEDAHAETRRVKKLLKRGFLQELGPASPGISDERAGSSLCGRGCSSLRNYRPERLLVS